MYMSRLLSLVLPGLLILSPFTVRGQELDRKSLLAPPPAGAWSRFKLTDEKPEKAKSFYVAAVRREEFEGAPHLWLELTSVDMEGDSLSVAGLYPAAEEMGLEAKKIVLKVGKSEAQEIPANIVRVGAMLASKFGVGIDFEELAESIRQNLDGGITSSPAARERLSVGGRSIQTQRIVARDSHGHEAVIWLSPQVPLFSFVRAEYEGSVIELTGWGAGGAASRIGTDYRPFSLGEIMKRMTGK